MNTKETKENKKYNNYRKTEKHIKVYIEACDDFRFVVVKDS